MKKVFYLLCVFFSFSCNSQICTLILQDSSVVIVKNKKNLKRIEVSTFMFLNTKILMGQFSRTFNEAGNILEENCNYRDMQEVRKYTYHENGFIKAYQSFEKGKLRHSKSYNTTGLMTEELIEEGFHYKKRQILYNSKNQIISDVKILNQSTETEQFTYDNLDRISKFVFINDSLKYGFLETQWKTYSYDGPKLNVNSYSLFRKVSNTGRQGVPSMDSTFIGKVNYTYDSKNRLTKIDNEIDHIYIENTFDELGNTIQKKIENANLSKCIINDKGKETECQYFDSGGKLTTKLTNIYNESGKLAKIISHNELSEKTEATILTPDRAYTYKNNENGDWVERNLENMIVTIRKLTY